MADGASGRTPEGIRRRGGARRGAGTLLFAAFAVLAFLFIMGLFNWLTSFVTRGTRILNQGAMARMLAESAINEAVFNAGITMNNYTDGPDEGLNPIFSGQAESSEVSLYPADGGLKADATTALARASVEDGGLGLGASFPDIIVAVKAAREQAMTDVDRRGLITFVVKVKVGDYGREMSRAFEYFRYRVVPPGGLGKYTFVGIGWNYYLKRWQSYYRVMLQHRFVRAAIIWLLAKAYGIKSSVATNAQNYVRRVCSVLSSDMTKATTLEAQLAGYQDQKFTATWPGDAPDEAKQRSSQFTLPYFFRLAYLDISPLMNNVNKSLALPVDIDAESDKFKFRDDFSSLTGFDTVVAGLLSDARPTSSGGGAVAAPPGGQEAQAYLEGLDATYKPRVEEFLKEESRKFWEVGASFDAGLDGTSIPEDTIFPVFTEESPVESKQLEFHNVALPTDLKEVKDSGQFPTVIIPPADAQVQTQGGQKVNGSSFFYFDGEKDLGMPTAEVATASNLKPPTPGSDAQSYCQQMNPGAVASPGGTPPAFPGGNAQWFAADAGAFATFESYWTGRVGEFRRIHIGDGSSSPSPAPSPGGGGATNDLSDVSAQLTWHRDKVKLAGLADDENLKKPEASAYISAPKNEERSCFVFPHMGAFVRYLATQSAAAAGRSGAAPDPDTISLGGLYYVKGDADLKIPKKYLGQGMIATEGNILIEGGVVKGDPAECGNLILIAGKDVVIGGPKIEAAVMSQNSIKPKAAGQAKVEITGSVIVRDTTFNKEAEDKAGATHEDILTARATSSLPDFKVTRDDNMVDDGTPGPTGRDMLVICPYRTTQTVRHLSRLEEVMSH